MCEAAGENGNGPNRTNAADDFQPDPVEVAAGVVRDRLGRVLIARRTDARGGGLDGLWEFPGGKREPGESLEACLKRELLEELNLAVEPTRVLGEIAHQAGERRLRLVFLEAMARGDEPLALCAHTDARWVEVAQLGAYAFCPADAAFLKIFPMI